MSVYSNKEILAGIECGHIVCFPLNKDYIRGSSIDLTLGYNFYACDRGEDVDSYNPFDKEDVDRYFEGPLKAETHYTWCSKNKRELFNNIPVHHAIIVLRPRERILAHSHEFIGIYPPGTTEMRARSTWGRNGIAVCLCAGWGDPGFINRWTMEVLNTNDKAVPLPVGERIAQLVFHSTGPVSGSYGENGKYQSGTDLKKVVYEWTPEKMLPKSYTDERRLPDSTSPLAVEKYFQEVARAKKKREEGP